MPAVVVAGGLIMAIGLIDDRWGLDALTKFAGQITAASVLVTMGVAWSVLYIPIGGVGTIVLDQASSILLTLALTVSVVNAMNFVDGLDGLAAGIGLISAAATCAFSLKLLQESGGDVNNYAPALIAATLAGACLGFLPHNFQPAKIFMGDSGSMLIGLMMAAASTSASGRLSNPDGTETIALLSPLLVVAAVLFVPLLDLLLAVIRRTRKGLSPFHADKMHLHHRLLEIGHSQRRAVLLIYLWAAVLAFGAVALTLFDAFAVAWGMGVGLLIALVISAIPRLRENGRS
jgi:UDP-GlcNAc:undecaprenyl-phosphate/decaprenyl-phosphate GlcNAc-1-phosphate transferase